MTTTRRGFLGTAIGALGAGLVASCSERLPRFLIPYAIPPDDSIPGIAQFYRTVCRECTAGCGVTARVREGRVVKLEGSVDHPVSRGALCPRGQSAVEGLYAAERLGTPRSAIAELDWAAAEHALADGIVRALEAKKLVVVLTRPEPGSMGTLFRTWLTALGQAPEQVVTFDPMDQPWLREGNRRAFGTETLPRLDLPAAKLLISIGDDFVEDGSPVESARGLAQLRAAGGRFIYVGPRMSLTAAAADEWLSTEPGAEIFLVLGLAHQVLELSGSTTTAGTLASRLAAYDLATVASRTKLEPAAITRLARMLVEARPSLCVGPGRAVAGDNAPALAEAVAVLNAIAGNVGRTMHFSAPANPPLASMTLAELGRRASAGEVGALVVHHANPHGYAPYAALAKSLERVPFVAAFVNQLDETARHAHLVMPDHHFLESWSDVTPRMGVTGVQQPAMTPVLATRAAADELLAAARALAKITGLPDGSFAEVVRAAFDESAIERGGRFTEPADEPVTLAADVLATAAVGPTLRGPSDGFPLVVAPTLRHLDGLPPRGMLLQELPDPLTNYSWTGWVELHPTTADALGVDTGDVLALASTAGHAELPVHVSARVRAGLVAVPIGHALALLDEQGDQPPVLGFVTRVKAHATGDRVELPHARGGNRQHGRELSRKVPRSLPQLPKTPALPSMYPPVEHPVHRWGLAIDLDSCNGCGACVAACYVENNLPVVGAEEVARGRAMSWLDVQTFTDGSPAGPEISFLPLMCQHCTNAPCESVCPTEATYHTKEGLNAQVYTRCIGTRYCENNCPYGVRRFNFFDWRRDGRERLGLNPDVTVRERGVSEKCTLCVQRIRGGEEQAKVEGRPVRDGEIVSACAATCPAQAITFGDLKDPSSKISKLAASGRAYHLLEELNTQPGVVYLARRRDKVAR